MTGVARGFSRRTSVFSLQCCARHQAISAAHANHSQQAPQCSLPLAMKVQQEMPSFWSKLLSATQLHGLSLEHAPAPRYSLIRKVT